MLFSFFGKIRRSCFFFLLLCQQLVMIWFHFSQFVFESTSTSKSRSCLSIRVDCFLPNFLTKTFFSRTSSRRYFNEQRIHITHNTLILDLYSRFVIQSLFDILFLSFSFLLTCKPMVTYSSNVPKPSTIDWICLDLKSNCSPWSIIVCKTLIECGKFVKTIFYFFHIKNGTIIKQKANKTQNHFLRKKTPQFILNSFGKRWRRSTRQNEPSFGKILLSSNLRCSINSTSNDI